jgi:hypothetical protein
MQLLRASTRFRWWLAIGVFAVTLPVTIASLGVGDIAVAGETGSLQRLRLCFDRWNQGRMIDWGPSIAAVSSSPRCTVSLAYVTTRDPSFSCKPGVVWPGRTGYCLDRHSTFVCELNHRGAYLCPGHVNGGPLGTENARLSRSGRLTPEKSLHGTHSTSLLAWQRRYTFRDGYIYPMDDVGHIAKRPYPDQRLLRHMRPVGRPRVPVRDRHRVSPDHSLLPAAYRTSEGNRGSLSGRARINSLSPDQDAAVLRRDSLAQVSSRLSRS